MEEKLRKTYNDLSDIARDRPDFYENGNKDVFVYYESTIHDKNFVFLSHFKRLVKEDLVRCIRLGNEYCLDEEISDLQHILTIIDFYQKN